MKCKLRFKIPFKYNELPIKYVKYLKRKKFPFRKFFYISLKYYQIKT